MTEANFTPAGTPRRTEAYPSTAGQRPKSNAIDPTKPQPSKRAEEVSAERRRRKDTGPMVGLKLHVPPELMEPGFKYRWVTDDGGRIQSKTVDDDWDVVRTKAIDGAGEGTPVSRRVGKTKSGEPQMAFLCKKPEHFYKADKAKEQAERVDAREKAILRGDTSDPRGLSGRHAYLPDQNTLTAEVGRVRDGD